MRHMMAEKRDLRDLVTESAVRGYDEFSIRRCVGVTGGRSASGNKQEHGNGRRECVCVRLVHNLLIKCHVSELLLDFLKTSDRHYEYLAPAD